MNKYVVIGTYPNGNKRAFVLMESSTSKAIEIFLSNVKDNFINIEVIDTYDGFTAIGMASFYSNGKGFYKNVSDAMLLIEKTMAEYKIAEAIDVYGEVTDKFHERFDKFYKLLGSDEKDALLSLAGMAKQLVKILELAGHDCL
jgi:hypothetical protein